jgi:hypothetical protein
VPAGQTRFEVQCSCGPATLAKEWKAMFSAHLIKFHDLNMDVGFIIFLGAENAVPLLASLALWCGQASDSTL